MSTQSPTRAPGGAAGTTNGCRVVARFLDGNVAKGTTHDFAPMKKSFHLVPDGGGAMREIAVTELKALFYVNDYVGDAKHEDHYDFDAVPGHGRKATVTFNDGEVISGYTMGYHPERAGFFVVPAETDGNNARVFVCNAAVKDIEWV